VYFYEAAARHPGRARLEDVRRGEFEGVSEAVRTGVARRPDIGGPELHTSAGATIVGARKFLIAWNVNLATPDVAAARAIARRIRASSGGFPHVKALGLPLPSRGQTQVSMNLTDFEQTPMHVVFDAIRREADAMSVRIAGTEIIGLLPRAALEAAADRYFAFENFRADMVLERRIDELLPFGIDDLLDEISDPSRATGGGSAAALAGAMASALGVLVCRLAGQDASVFTGHRECFAFAIQADAAAFAALMRTGQPSEDALIQAAEVPLAIAERAAELGRNLRSLRAVCPERYSSDLDTALGLAESARRGGIATARLNLAAITSPDARKLLEKRAEAIS
jgi:formiminotetrahydrofolate cyclodeaminase